MPTFHVLATIRMAWYLQVFGELDFDIQTKMPPEWMAGKHSQWTMKLHKLDLDNGVASSRLNLAVTRERYASTAFL